MPHKPTPRWQPIAALARIARVIDGQLEAAEEQHRLLRLARPGSLDNATVERVVRVFTEEVELLAVYSEQLDRWRSGSLTVAQRLEVERLSGQLAHNRYVDAAILTLAENLKATTIDAILAKSDLELGLEVFTDRSPPTTATATIGSAVMIWSGLALPGSASQIQASHTISVVFAAITTATPMDEPRLRRHRISPLKTPNGSSGLYTSPRERTKPSTRRYPTF